jgi:hypothetical protein
MAYIMTGLAVTISGFAAEITDFGHDGMERVSEESTHMLSAVAGAAEIGGREFILGKLADPGGLSISGNHDPDIVPPLGAAAASIVVTFPLLEGQATATIYTGPGGMTGYNYTGTVEGKATFTATLKFTGKITVTESTDV